MSAPTICRACGGKIEEPDGRHVCEHCDCVLRGRRHSVDDLTALYEQEPPLSVNTPRPDPDDITPMVLRMLQQEHDEAIRQKWQKRGAACFTGLAIAVAIVFIIWGCRQLP